MDIASVRLSALAHATEEPRKVVSALNEVCSREKFHPGVVKRVVKGHFGNAITRIDLELFRRAANDFFKDFWQRLPNEDRDATIAEIATRLDEEGKLHLRVDKQESFRSLLRIGNQDSIKIEVSFRAWSGSVDEVQRFLNSM